MQKQYFNNLHSKSITETKKFWMTITLPEKCPNTEFFFVVRIQPSMEKYGPEKLRIWTLFTQRQTPLFNENDRIIKDNKKVSHTFNSFMTEVPVI